MPNEHRPLNVFLSYASQDRPVVRELLQRLIGEGWIEPWLDEKNLLPGQDWRLKIEEAVEDSDVVIICLSSNSVTREGYVQKELRYAREMALEKPEGTIFLIPLRLDECEVPRGLRFYQWVDYFGDKKDESYSALVESLKLRRAQKLMLEEAELARKERLECETVDRVTQEKAERQITEKKAEIVRPLPRAERSKPEKRAVSYKPNTAIIAAVIGLVGTLGAALISSPLLANLFSRTPEPTTVASTSTATRTLAPSETPTKVINPTPTETKTPAPSETSTELPLPTQVTDSKGVTMRLVPAGEFTMGSNGGDGDERPVHSAYLGNFYMDIYEVTNALYRSCVEAGVCTAVQNENSESRYHYYSNSKYDDYPVVYVNWNQANIYCAWRGASLPTEAQWEKAARGVDGRTYPWGEGIDCTRANYRGKNGSCIGDTTKVGGYESGKSPYGIYDLSGNVWEWVADWYSSTYYQNSSYQNPLGVDSGEYRVLRGGSWMCTDQGAYASIRGRYTPDFIYDDIGFRCVRSP